MNSVLSINPALRQFDHIGGEVVGERDDQIFGRIFNLTDLCERRETLSGQLATSPIDHRLLFTFVFYLPPHMRGSCGAVVVLGEKLLIHPHDSPELGSQFITHPAVQVVDPSLRHFSILKITNSICIHYDTLKDDEVNREKLRQVRRREGRYLLRTNLGDRDPADLWQFYIQLTEVEAAFKNLKDDLQLRPIYHQVEHRVEAHIFVAFLAYCLHVTLRARLKPLAPGLTSRAVLDKMAAVQMLDVHFPTTDGRMLILSRYTELNADQKLLLKQLKFDLPPQPPPRITSSQSSARTQVPVL